MESKKLFDVVWAFLLLVIVITFILVNFVFEFSWINFVISLCTIGIVCIARPICIGLYGIIDCLKSANKYLESKVSDKFFNIVWLVLFLDWVVIFYFGFFTGEFSILNISIEIVGFFIFVYLFIKTRRMQKKRCMLKKETSEIECAMLLRKIGSTKDKMFN